jgi:hypothetical protein
MENHPSTLGNEPIAGINGPLQPNKKAHRSSLSAKSKTGKRQHFLKLLGI